MFILMCRLSWSLYHNSTIIFVLFFEGNSSANQHILYFHVFRDVIEELFILFVTLEVEASEGGTSSSKPTQTFEAAD